MTLKWWNFWNFILITLYKKKSCYLCLGGREAELSSTSLMLTTDLFMVSSILLNICIRIPDLILLIDAVKRAVIFLNIFKISSETKVFCFINIAAVFNVWQVIRKWLKQGKAQRERNSCNTTCQEDMLAKLSSIRTGTSTNAIVNYFYNVFTIAGKGIARKVLITKRITA